MRHRAAATLARLERQTLDRQRQALAATDAALEALDQRLTALDGELAARVRTGQPSDQETALALTMAGATVEALRLRRQHVADEHRRLAAKRDSQAQALRQRIVEVKAMETVVVRRHRQALLAADRRSQNEQDDLTLQRLVATATDQRMV